MIPQRIKTLYPNIENIAYDVDTPIPIETAFFLEDAEKDPVKINRYHFKFPGNWITSNNGEKIVGVRDIWMLKPKRRLEFSIWLLKVLKTVYDKVPYYYKGIHNRDEIYHILIDKYRPGNDYDCNELKVVYEMAEYEDLSKLGDVIRQSLKEHITKWQTSIIGSSTIYKEDDIKVVQIHDTDGFYIDIEYNQNSKEELEKYYFFFQMGSYNDDFKEVFNIGELPFENNIKLLKIDPNFHYETYFEPKLHFTNLWDRAPCKIYSSIAEQSLHQYVGNSNVYFSPIKYYKLRSTDQTFWVDFVSSSYHNLPIRLPKSESFCIEMQFLPYDKMI